MASLVALQVLRILGLAQLDLQDNVQRNLSWNVQTVFITNLKFWVKTVNHAHFF